MACSTLLFLESYICSWKGFKIHDHTMHITFISINYIYIYHIAMFNFRIKTFNMHLFILFNFLKQHLSFEPVKEQQ